MSEIKTENIKKEECLVKEENNDITKENVDIKSVKDELLNNNDNDDDDDKKDPSLNEFYSEIDEIKGVNFKSNSKKEIDRLLRPGSTYFNLNPFDVLQIDPYASIDDVKSKYRKLSIYVHPDKNKDDLERAQQAFEALNKAYKMLEDEKERKKCLEVVDEARERVDNMIIEKRKKLKKDSKTEAKIDEDDPDKYRQAIYTMTCKLFADLERLKVKEAEKKSEEKKRRADEKSEDEVKTKIQKEWDKNYEESREGRVSSWKNFKAKGKVQTTSLKLPRHKPESR